MLQHFAGDIQAQIGRVHYTAHKIKAIGQQIRTLVHNHHTRAVKLQTRLKVIGVVLVVCLRRDKQQRLVGHSALSGHRNHRLRCGILTESFLIELVILLLGNLALLALPQGHHAVQGIVFENFLVFGIFLGTSLFQLRMGHQHFNGETDVVGVLFHQLVQRIFAHILAIFVLLLAILLDVHDDIRTDSFLFTRLNGVTLHAGGFPTVSLFLAVLFRHHGDAVGHHEGRVETDAKLTDNIRFLLGVVIHLLAELEAAAGRNHTQVVLQLLLAHADTVIADSQCTVLLIQRQANLKVITLHTHLVIR